MANNSDDTPQAWVWSEYRGEQAGGAPVVGEVLTVVETGDATHHSAAAPSSKGGNTAGLVLAAFVLTVLGFLWFTSGGDKPAATADKSATPAVSSEAPPPSEPAPAPAATAPADPAPAAAAPTAAPEKPAPRRPRRHR